MKGDRQTANVPIETISDIPIYMFVAGNDNFCPREQAEWTAEQIGDAVREVRIFDGQDHGYFTYSLDLVLMNSLLYALGHAEDVSKTRFFHDSAAWEENNEIGFAPFYKQNKIDPFNILQ